MSKHLFERLEIGYNGVKSRNTINKNRSDEKRCNLPWCENPVSIYKGVGSRLCETHQRMMREYGGPGRTDRPYTFNKKPHCEKCEINPWKDDPLIKLIGDPLIRDRLAWGMLIVDHIHTQRDGGNDWPDNCQTLCMNCNQIKTTLACDSMPRALYSSTEDYEQVVNQLRPWLIKLVN